MKLRRMVVAAVLLLGAFAGGGVFPNAAGAVNCPSGYSCIWRDTSYLTDGVDSSRISFYSSHSNFGASVYSGTSYSGANSASSVSNTGVTNTACYYRNTSYQGTGGFCLSINTGDGNLSDSTGNAPGGYNNDLESGRFV